MVNSFLIKMEARTPEQPSRKPEATAETERGRKPKRSTKSIGTTIDLRFPRPDPPRETNPEERAGPMEQPPMCIVEIWKKTLRSRTCKPAGAEQGEVMRVAI
jgi:hypothetical protein